MRVETLTDGMDEACDEFLRGRDYSLINYSSKFRRFLRRLLGCEDESLVAADGGRVRGLLPLMCAADGRGRRVYNSLPYFGTWGGVVADGAQAYGALAEGYNEIARRAGSTLASTVIANAFSPHAGADAAALAHSHLDRRVGQYTELSAWEDPRAELMSRIDASARRNVNKAAREGVTVETDCAQWDALRRMHQSSMSAMGGTPKGDEFFQLVPRCFAPGEDYDLYVARRDGAVVSGLLVFYFNRTVEYFLPATDGEHQHLQPLSLILIEAMADACRRGFRRWNWGGTWPTQTGVYRFKRKWAAAERDYYYYTQLNDPAVLEMRPAEIAAAFPHFFVVPYSALKASAGATA